HGGDGPRRGRPSSPADGAGVHGPPRRDGAAWARRVRLRERRRGRRVPVRGGPGAGVEASRLGGGGLRGGPGLDGARTDPPVRARAVQRHGAAGESEDTPLASMYAAARTLRIVDGPDEVNEMVIARRELKRFLPG